MYNLRTFALQFLNDVHTCQQVGLGGLELFDFFQLGFQFVDFSLQVSVATLLMVDLLLCILNSTINDACANDGGKQRTDAELFGFLLALFLAPGK